MGFVTTWLKFKELSILQHGFLSVSNMSSLKSPTMQTVSWDSMQRNCLSRSENIFIGVIGGLYTLRKTMGVGLCILTATASIGKCMSSRVGLNICLTKTATPPPVPSLSYRKIEKSLLRPSIEGSNLSFSERWVSFMDTMFAIWNKLSHAMSTIFRFKLHTFRCNILISDIPSVKILSNAHTRVSWRRRCISSSACSATRICSRE